MRDGVETSAGAREWMEVDSQADTDVTIVRHFRRAKWAVGIQPSTSRPPACKSCNIPFSTSEIRVTTWGSRTTSRWFCFNCAATRVADADLIEPHGRGNAEHKDALEAAVAAANQAGRPEETSQGASSVPNQCASSLEHVRAIWDANQIPGREWWDELPWKDAMQIGSNTFVQVPDRYRGAVLDVRQKAMEILLARTEASADSSAEWSSCCSLTACCLPIMTEASLAQNFWKKGSLGGGEGSGLSCGAQRLAKWHRQVQPRDRTRSRQTV